MSQNECMKELEKAKEWLTTKQIAERLKVNCCTAATNLRRLYNQNAVQRKVTKKSWQWRKK